MTMTSRRGLRIAGAAGLGTLLIVGTLVFMHREPATPIAPRQAKMAWPVAPEQSPPKAQAQPPKVVQVAQIERQDYIDQAKSIDLARRAVEKAGGRVTGELDIIRAVGASLDGNELAALYEQTVDGLRVYEDVAVSASAASALPETFYPFRWYLAADVGRPACDRRRRWCCAGVAASVDQAGSGCAGIGKP